MKRTDTVTVHVCDGCQSRYLQLNGDDLPNGLFVQVFEVHPGGAAAGDIYVCRESCLLKAFKRRHDVWNPPEETQ